jgi:putative intracellular protease/amidase
MTPTAFFRTGSISTALAVTLVLTTGYSPLAQPADTSEVHGVRVLFLMSRNYGVNYFLDRDRFEEYGWSVTHTGLLDTVPPCGFYYLHYQVAPIVPDVLVSDIASLGEYDVLTLSSSTKFLSPVPYDEFLNSPEVLALIRNAVDQGMAVYAPCHGSRVLAAADVIRGKETICDPKYRSEIERAGGAFVDKDHPPVIAGSIVTGARDQYNNVVNNQAIATVIEEQRRRRGRKEAGELQGFAIGQPVLTQGEVMWARTIGGSRADGARAICETGDGGFLMAGYTFSEGSGDADMWVVRTDAEGEVQWTRTLGGAGTEYAYACAADDDGYVITGYTTSFGAGSKDVYLVKLNRKGEEEWSETFGGASWDVGQSVCVTSDGGFLICGFTHSSGAGEEDVYVVRTDRDGQPIWSRTYGGARLELGHSVYESADGSIMVGASTGTFGPEGNTNAYLLKLDKDGNEIWSEAHGTQGQLGHGFDWCRAMCLTGDGGAVQVGYTDAEDIMNIYAVKADAQGKEVWSKTFGASKFYDFAQAVRRTADGGFIVSGTAKLNGDVTSPYNNQVYLARLDSNGERLWEKVIGGPQSDWGSAILETSDGNFIVAGHTLSGGAGHSDVLIMKVSCEPPPAEEG